MSCLLHFPLVLTAFLMAIPLQADPAVSEETIRSVLTKHSVRLHGAGEALLVAEARSHDFFF
jgi:hypothetical protein